MRRALPEGTRVFTMSTPHGGCHMKWTKPEFAVVELGMEVGAYAGNA